MLHAQPVLTTVNSMTRTGRAARRLVLFERAKEAMGSARRLGEVIGVGRRNVHQKLENDRYLTDWELKLAADEIERMARDLDRLAADIRQVLP